MTVLDETAAMVDMECAPTREQVMAARVADSGANDIEAIYRMWAWFKHWGHEPPCLNGLDDLPLTELRARMQHEAARVRLLAETWETWW